MRVSAITLELVSVGVLAAALAACGNSTPLPSSGPASSASAAVSGPAAAYTPSSGAFAAVPASALQGRAPTSSCNLDAVNGQPVGGAPLPQASTAMFAGWAADAEDKAVPANVQLVLHGDHADYGVEAATGMPRPDVASANKLSVLATSGYEVRADLAAVAPGTYTPVLEFDVVGKRLTCTTQAKVTVE